MPIAITKANYNAQTHVLKLMTADVEALATNLFSELKDQFGPEATKPPTPVKLAQASIVIGQTETKLGNALNINWYKAAATLGQPRLLPGTGS